VKFLLVCLIQPNETFLSKLYFGFVDLEKAFDRVPREVISWAMRKLGVEEWLVSAVMSMSDLICSRPRSEGWPHHGRTFFYEMISERSDFLGYRLQTYISYRFTSVLRFNY